MIEPMQPLDYAKAPPLLRRRIRRFGIVLALVILIFAVARWRRAAYKQASLLYWQHQCMTWTPPAETALFEPDPLKAAALMHGPLTDYYDYATSPSGAVFLRPRSLREFDAAQPTQWSDIHEDVFTDAGVIGRVTIFLHERRSPDGQRRLVVIESHGYEINGLSPIADLRFRVYVPAGIFSYPRRVDGNRKEEFIGRYEPAGVRVAVADEADPTHFAIPFSYNGKSRTIDGWLRDDNNVRFEVRDGHVRRP